MKIKYDGPRHVVGVAGFGDHKKGEVKDYPDEIAEELLATSTRQRFSTVDAPTMKPKPKAADKPAKDKADK